MSTMPLVRIHGPNDIRTDQVERPRIGPNDSSICGSDLR